MEKKEKKKEEKEGVKDRKEEPKDDKKEKKVEKTETKTLLRRNSNNTNRVFRQTRHRGRRGRRRNNGFDFGQNNNNWGGIYDYSHSNMVSFNPFSNPQKQWIQRGLDQVDIEKMKEEDKNREYKFNVHFLPETEHDNQLLRKDINQQKLTPKVIPKIEQAISGSGELIKLFNTNVDTQVEKYIKMAEESKKNFQKYIERNVKELNNRIITFREIQKKKKKDDFKIVCETEYTQLLTNCYDVFEIIFTYLDTKTLFLTIMPTCVFFMNVVQHKIIHKIEIPSNNFLKVEVDDVLNGLTIEEIKVLPAVVNFGNFWGNKTREEKVVNPLNNLRRIVGSNAKTLKKLEVRILDLFPRKFNNNNNNFGGFGYYQNTNTQNTNEKDGDDTKKKIEDLFTQLSNCKLLNSLGIVLIEFPLDIMKKMTNLSELIIGCKIVFNNTNLSKELVSLTSYLQECGYQLRKFSFCQIFVNKENPNNCNTVVPMDKEMKDFYKVLFFKCRNLIELKIDIFPEKFKIEELDYSFFVENNLEKLTLCVNGVDAFRANNWGGGNLYQPGPLTEKEKSFEDFLEVLEKNSSNFKKIKLVYSTRTKIKTSTFSKITKINGVSVKILPNVQWSLTKDNAVNNPNNWGFANGLELQEYFENFDHSNSKICKFSCYSGDYSDITKSLLLKGGIKELCIKGVRGDEVLRILEKYFPTLLTSEKLEKFTIESDQKTPLGQKLRKPKRENLQGFGRLNIQGRNIEEQEIPKKKEEDTNINSYLISMLTQIVRRKSPSLKEIVFKRTPLYSLYSSMNYFGGNQQPVFFHRKMETEKATKQQLQVFLEALKDNKVLKVMKFLTSSKAPRMEKEFIQEINNILNERE